MTAAVPETTPTWFDGTGAYSDPVGALRIALFADLLGRLPAYAAGSLDVQVQGRDGLTPYARIGNASPLALAAVLTGAGAFGSLRLARRASVGATQIHLMCVFSQGAPKVSMGGPGGPPQPDCGWGRPRHR